jgi:hypothetical protein
MAYKVLIPVLAVLGTVRWTTGNPRPVEFTGNLAMPIDITGEAMYKFLRRNEYQNSPKDMIQNVDRNSRALEFADSCSMATADKCNGIIPPDGADAFNYTNLMEQIKRIDTAIDCQLFCSYYYGGNCTWWMYDETIRYCKIFKGPVEELYDDCFELGFSSNPSVAECKTAVDPVNNDQCDYFRQDYCRYERDFLDNLEHSHDIESCQWACQVNPECNFFTFSTDENVCMLHRVDVRTRVCDIIHGPPTPTLQSCLDDGEIPWAASSRLAEFMPTTADTPMPTTPEITTRTTTTTTTSTSTSTSTPSTTA